MRSIYSQCSRDLFWLGPEDESTVEGLQILKRLDGFKLADIESFSWRRYDSEYTEKTTWTLTKGHWSILKALLLDLAIWKRVWMVQEISSAPYVLLVCGSTALNWAVIERLLEGGNYYIDAFHSPLSHDSSSLATLFERAQVIKTQRQVSRSLYEGGESSLLDVLARFK
jgi:hypothetical protein